MADEESYVNVQTQTQNTDDLLSVEYYAGADGPIIHMGARSMNALILARDIFFGLAHNAFQHVQLHELAWVKMINIKALVLNRVPEGKEGLRTLRRVRGTAPELVFAWSREPEGWLECAEKLDPLIEKDKPGHQYLSLEYTDDALVEFTYRE